MLVDRQHRRLGDLAAGTVLVREERFDLAKYAQASAGNALSAEDLELVTSFMARSDSLDPEARVRIGRELVKRFGGPEALDEAGLRSFFEKLVG